MTVFEVCAEIPPDPDNPDPLDRLPFAPGCSERHINKLITKVKPLLSEYQLKKIPEDCPAFLQELYKKCCTKDPQDRPTFSEVHILLQQNFENHCSKDYISAMITLLKRMKNEPELEINQSSKEASENPLGTSRVLAHYQAATPSPAQQIQETVKSELAKFERLFQNVAQGQRVLSDQMLQQGRALSHQIQSTGETVSHQINITSEGLAQTVMMDAGDASNIPVECKPPVLKRNQGAIVEYLEPTDDTLKKLFAHGVIKRNEREKIEGQKSEKGRTKLLLLIVDGKGSDDIVGFMADALRETLYGNNKLLADVLEKDLSSE